MGEQKRIGNTWEVRLCELLQRNGFWCHLFEHGKNGQPCDVIALKGNDIAMLIDVKHCCGDRFAFSRVEPNQRTCFEYAMNICKVQRLGFAVYFESEGKFKWLAHKKLKWIESLGGKSVHYKDLPDFEFMIKNM